MAEFCTGRNVFEASLERVRWCFDNFDEVIVNVSGGKDSTICLELAIMVAKEKNKLPVKVMWLDQECEWQETVDYVDEVMRRKEVKPYWFQFEFDFTNSLSNQKNFVRLWDETKKDKWVHPKSDISIKTNPTKENRFHKLISALHYPMLEPTTKNAVVLIGMRCEENINRRKAIMYCRSKNRIKPWIAKCDTKIKEAYPIYDWTFDDVWIALCKNQWKYNKVYDQFYKWGVPKSRFRVSAMIHETAYWQIEYLQEIEPKTYDRFCNRINGVDCYSHSFENKSIQIKELPYMFKDWKEYRDYLLVHLVKKEYWDLFKERWKDQNDDKWYKVHITEVLANDIDGTKNRNTIGQRSYDERAIEKKKILKQLINKGEIK